MQTPPAAGDAKYTLHLIVSMTPDGLIGNRGTQPWNIPEDLANFKRLTLGHPVIMGRVTYHVLGRPLPGRINLVLSDRPSETIPGVIICRSLPEALKQAAAYSRDIFSIGGQRVYQQTLPLADVLHISWIKGRHIGTTYFPRLKLEEWKKVSAKDFAQFTYAKYKRKNAKTITKSRP